MEQGLMASGRCSGITGILPFVLFSDCPSASQAYSSERACIPNEHAMISPSSMFSIGGYGEVKHAVHEMFVMTKH